MSDRAIPTPSTPADEAPNPSSPPSQADLDALAAAAGEPLSDGETENSAPSGPSDPAGIDDPAEAVDAAGVATLAMPNFEKVLQEAQATGIDLLRDVNLEVKIELGRSRLLVEDVLKLVEGSVVELDKLAGDPVDVFVNDRLVARGEVLVLNDNFCVRVNEIVESSREEDL